jgi:hypothetical protein
MEEIVSIKEDLFDIENSEYEGFIIETNKQKIYIGVDAYQYCCESFGALISEDNINKFIGAELLNIKITDNELKSYDFLENLFEGGTMFVDIETNKGVFQIAVYNIHNGYYGHEAIVKSEKLNYECYI